MRRKRAHINQDLKGLDMFPEKDFDPELPSQIKERTFRDSPEQRLCNAMLEEAWRCLCGYAEVGSGSSHRNSPERQRWLMMIEAEDWVLSSDPMDTKKFFFAFATCCHVLNIPVLESSRQLMQARTINPRLVPYITNHIFPGEYPTIGESTPCKTNQPPTLAIPIDLISTPSWSPLPQYPSRL